jgi:hypothetical protein
VKPKLLPLPENDLFKKTFTGFPEAPGAVIFNFMIFIGEEDPLILKFSGADHPA